MFTEAELAYAAGIIDGEGCLAICKGQNRLKRGRTKPNFTALVGVGMTDAVVPRWLQVRWGGHIMTTKKPGCRTMYSWRVYSTACERFLEDIKGYLLIKREQAVMLLVHRAMTGRNGPAVSYRASAPGRQGAIPRPKALTRVHERIYERVKALNQRQIDVHGQ